MFQFFSAPLLNADGDIAFAAQVDGGSGIWSNTDGSLRLVASTGSPAPGLSTAATFSYLAPPQLNASGKTAFWATLNHGGAIDATNDSGVWAEDSRGLLKSVIQAGDLFMVGTGDMRTFAYVNFARQGGLQSSGEDGRVVSWTDDFTLAFTLDFTDGTSGVFTATLVPEPQAWLMAWLGMGVLRRRQERR